MMGLVLWYKSDKKQGIVWCEDQGPLAYIGPDVDLLYDSGDLDTGVQLVFRFEESDGVRHVREVFSLTRPPEGADLGRMLLEQFGLSGAEPDLRVVA